MVNDGDSDKCTDILLLKLKSSFITKQQSVLLNHSYMYFVCFQNIKCEEKNNCCAELKFNQGNKMNIIFFIC